jgi:hypothetical protein
MLPWTLIVRAAIGLVGLVLLVAGLVAFALSEPLAGGWAIVSGAVLLGAAVFEAGRYASRTDGTPRPAGFQPTDEVFDDPMTGERVRVWFDPKSGARRYEPEG